MGGVNEKVSDVKNNHLTALLIRASQGSGNLPSFYRYY